MKIEKNFYCNNKGTMVTFDNEEVACSCGYGKGSQLTPNLRRDALEKVEFISNSMPKHTILSFMNGTYLCSCSPQFASGEIPNLWDNK